MQIKVSDLKPGDIIPANNNPAASHGLMLPRMAVLHLTSCGTPAHAVAGRNYISVIVSNLDGTGEVATHSWSVDSPIDVERAQEMSNAQKHADKLLEAVKGAAWIVKGAPTEWGLRFEKDWLPAAKTLIATIEPPPPPAPTLAEAFAALDALEDGARKAQAGEWDKATMQAEREKARDLINRARAAGVLK